MPQPWSSVENNPAYQSLPQEQKDAARQQYFNDVVAPQVPKEHLDMARQQFEAHSVKSPQVLAPRTNEAAQAILDNMTGQQPSAQLTALKVLGAGAGAVNDAAIAAIPQPIKNAANVGAQGVADAIDSTGAGQWVGDKLLNASNAVSSVAQAHPEATKVLSALGNIMPVAEAGEGVASVLGNAGQDIAAAREAIPKTQFPKAQAPLPLSSEAVKGASQNAYKYSENVGGVLHPDNFTNPMLDTIDEAKFKPIAGVLLTSEQKALNSALDEYSALRDKPLTLEDFQNIDKSLTAKESAAMNGFKPTNNSRIIGQLQDKVRDKLQSLKPAEVIGGKEGFDALTQHAIPLWSTQTKMADLEAIIDRANSMDNPVTAMRTGFRNLSLNKAKMAAYPEEVQALIRKAAINPSDILGIVGSRLNPIMNQTIAGKAANMATSGLARNFRNAMQNAKADKILSSLTEPVRGSVERFSTVPETPYAIKPEIPTEPANPYFNPQSKPLGKYLPNTALGSAFGEAKPVKPELQGTASTYYSKGGSVKRKNLTAEFLARAS